MERPAGPLRRSRGRGWARRCRPPTLPFGVVNAPGPALPPGDHRPGDRARSPRCTRAGSGWRWAPARPATSTSPATAGRARRCATPACASASTSSAPCCAARRSATTGWSASTAPRSTRPAEPPPLIGAAVSEATAAWCAEWADGLITVNAPVETLRRMIGAYRDAGGRGDLALQVHLSWAPDERRGRGARVRPVAQQRLPAPGLLGRRPRRDVRRDQRGRPARAGQAGRQRLVRPRRAHRPARRVRRAGVRQDHAAPRRAGAGGVRRRRSARRSCPSCVDSGGDRRMRLTQTSDLWWKNAVVYCLDVETYADGNGDGVRRLPRPDPAGSTTWPARRHLHLADAVLPVPGPRRRLRHHRLLRRRPAAGHARRLRRVRAHRPRPRHAGDRRPGGQPHLGRAPVVPVEARSSRDSPTATGTSGATRSPPTRPRASSSPTRRPASGSTTRRPASTTCTGSTSTSPT